MRDASFAQIHAKAMSAIIAGLVKEILTKTGDEPNRHITNRPIFRCVGNSLLQIVTWLGCHDPDNDRAQEFHA